jgi:hypothetical protein
MRSVMHDELLKRLADAGLEIGRAEALLDEGAATAAGDHLDAAESALADLRDRWADLSAFERRWLGAAARPAREQIEALRGRVPRHAPLSVGAPEQDPEEDEDPA